MSYRFGNGVHWCACGGRIVFLDLREDRYSCLPRTSEAAFNRFVHGGLERDDAPRLQPLVARGMLIEDPLAPPPGPPPAVPPVLENFLDELEPLRRMLDVATAVASQLRWTLRLRLRPLATIATMIETRVRRRPTSGVPDRRIARIISALECSSLVLPSANRCLVRALALHDLCCRSGVRPLLVFGVRVDPFRAHCWVQLNGKVLIGDFEQVRLFTPIAALG